MGDKIAEPAREDGAGAGDLDDLEAAGFADGNADRGFGDVQGLGEEGNEPGIGLALFGDAARRMRRTAVPSERVSTPSMRSGPALGVTRRLSVSPVGVMRKGGLSATAYRIRPVTA
ncbi:MAG: hypothetical protein ABIQ30_03555 [Devosia sp.]